MELRLLSLFVMVLVVAARCSGSPSPRGHVVQRRDANPDVNYDEEVMADEADEEPQQDEGDEDDEDDDLAQAKIDSLPENFTVRRGQTVRLPCSVSSENTSGTSPVLQWLKDNNSYYLGKMRTNSPPKIRLENTDLIVSEVNMTDAGRYTCKIAGTDIGINHTISVTEPATIIDLSATDRGQVAEGTDTVITCTTVGTPPPTLIWSKTSAGENARLTEHDVEFTHNSIVIKNISHHQAGTYICYADNKLGARPDAKQINIRVLGKPVVHIAKHIVNTKPGVEALLQCSAHRVPESHIRWYKDGRPVEDVEDNFVIKTEGQHSNLTITPREDSDFGTYTCEAENMYGKHEKSIKLVKEPVIEDLDSDGPKLTWTIHSYLPLREIELQLKAVNGSDFRIVSIPVPEPSHATGHLYHITHEVKDLETGQYIANVRAKNDHNWGDHSESTVDIAPEPAKILGASVLRGSATRTTSVILPTALMYILLRFF